MGFPSLGSLLQVGIPALGGHAAGQTQGFLLQRKLRQEDADRKAESDRRVLQMALLNAEIAKAQQPQGWEPTSKAEYLETHPHNPPQTENIDPLSETGIAAALKKLQEEKELGRKYPDPTAGGDRRPEWQKQGYGSFEAWRKDKETGTGAPQQGERVAASLMPRAEAGDAILDAAPTPNAIQRGLSKVPFVGNYMANPEYQKYQQAGEQFITAILRPESGAQITESELETARRMFVPQPGDTPEVIAQKDAARTRAIEQLRTMAGRSAPAATTADTEIADPITRAYRPENPFVEGAK